MKTFFFFFGEHLRLCPWFLASSIPVLGLKSVCPRKGCPWPWPRIFFVSLSLASSLVSSTPPLLSSTSVVCGLLPSPYLDGNTPNILKAGTPCTKFSGTESRLNRIPKSLQDSQTMVSVL